MKIIDQSHKIIERHKYSPAQLIELCGRVCYKSEDKITDTSASKFVKMITKRGHLSVLEHGAFAVRMDQAELDAYIEKLGIDAFKFLNVSDADWQSAIVSGNLRAWLEFYDRMPHNGIPEYFIEKIENTIFRYCQQVLMAWPSFNEELISKTSAAFFIFSEEYLIQEGWKKIGLKHTFETVRFITNRSVTHELVRHRPASYSQESTRYVNYGGDEMQFIKPVWVNDHRPDVRMPSPTDVMSATEFFISSCRNDELFYKRLLKEGWRPEQAREVLPNALKTEIVITANLTEWQHIFKLRCSKAAHPQIRELMLPVRDEFKERYPGVF